MKSFDVHYPNTKDEFQLRRRQQILKAISIIGNTTECMKSNKNQAEPTKKGPFWSSMPLADPCSDSLSELAEFDFQLLQDNVALMEEEGKFAKEILDVTKFTLDVKNKSKDNKPESLNLKPNFDLHLAKMQAIADRFTAPKPEVDSKRYQVENVSLKLNGKTTQLKHFILGYEGDFTINLNEFSEENITNNAKDKLLFVGAQASKKELLAVHGTIKDVKTVYDYLSPKKGKLTGKQLKDLFKNTSQARCDEVAKLINKYADKFEITMPLRMAHFLGQIGIESNNLNAMGEKSGEDPCYTKKNNAWDFNSGKGEGWIAKKKWSETPIDEGCDDFKKSLKGKRKHPNWDTVNDVPKKYVCTNDNPASKSGKILFNYVYRCEGGNGDEASGDGFRYRGHGVMQLTWKKQYVAFNDWLKTNGFVNDYKKVLSDPDEGFNDKEIDILSAMWYWDKEKINGVADKVKMESDLESFKKVTLKINKQAVANKDRNDIFKAAFNILK